METTKTKTMEKSNNYKLTFSNFYYKSNGKKMFEDEITENGEKIGQINSITVDKNNVGVINKCFKTNWDETNSREILQFYLDDVEENVDDLDYKVEIDYSIQST